MRNIGLIGTENSHTDHFIRFLNTEQRHPGYRAAVLVGGRTPRNDDLAAGTGITTFVDTPEELIGSADAAIVSTRDGALHRVQAEPLLAAGIPVLVDKPLATSVRDAEAIVDAAESSGATVFSCSALRHVPEVHNLRDEVAARGPLRQLTVIGPADPDSEYSGLFFYGIHHVEAAMEILGNPPVPGVPEIAAARRDGTVVAHTHLDGVDVTFVFVTPAGDHKVPFHVTATFNDSVTATDLTLGPDYNAGALAQFIGALEQGSPPLTRQELVAPVAVLSAIVATIGVQESGHPSGAPGS